ncbi:MAG TPA: hypothetical protein VFH78_11855 [Candidatus Thermoplasmatota archaeon]|nr:hypothetical protein [Candidatus Thermoplasmatota archaeon]
MAATVPPTPAALEPADEIPLLEGPQALVEEYLRLVEERRAVEDRLAFVRSELELLASQQLSDKLTRGRFVASRGAVAVRYQNTCVFDRAAVARELQRMGKLAEVAVLQGPGLARYLAHEPVVAARLADLVRMRRSIVLMASDR